MQKQQKYFSFRKHSVKCTYNKWSVQNEDSRLQTKYKMQTRYKMKTRYKMQTRYIMQTADCRLHFCTQSAVCSLKSAFCTDQYNRSIPVEVLSILFSISVGCWVAGVYHNEYWNKINSPFLFRVIYNEVHLLILFLAGLASFQAWESKIHVLIKSGKQPFPSANNINLKVPWSPISFFQKIIFISVGQDLIEKNPAPLIFLPPWMQSSNLIFGSFTLW